MQTTDKKLTVGFLGNGRIANCYQIPYLLARQEHFCIKAIYARHLEHTAWARVPGVSYTNDLSELLDDPEIGLLDIATPPESHFEPAKQVIQSGKHCVVEKPFTPPRFRRKPCSCWQNGRV